MTDRPQGIEGLQGREPVGVVLSAGIKGPSGAPIERDRYHLVVPHEADGRRAHHPGFAAFNSAPPEARRVIRGNLVHATAAECFELSLRAQVSKALGLKAHPNRRPVCSGDGVRAVRWTGGEDFTEVPCLHDLCPARLAEPAECKPWARLYFRLRWKDGSPLSTPLTKFTTGSWNTIANLKGFFDALDRNARELGLTDYTLFGLPFTLTLTEKTNAQRRSRFPVTVISEDMSPIDFFRWQRAHIRELQAPVVSLLEGPEHDPDVEFADLRGISGPTRIE